MKKDKFIKAIQKIDGFELRPQQIEMSETIESAIEELVK